MFLNINGSIKYILIMIATLIQKSKYVLNVRFAHLVSYKKKAIDVNNKLIVSSGKHLNSNIKINNTNPELHISQKNIKIGKNSYMFNISLNTESNIVKPTIFASAIDLSSSMNGSCTSETTSDSESSKFSRLDLVKHSLNTIINCLRPVDKLALIGFSNDSIKIVTLLDMDENSKQMALEKVYNMKANGSTNLWSGLNSSIDEIEIYPFLKNKNLFNVLLTDGESNVDPPRGIYQTFISKISKSGLKSSINTFGYGYHLDSNLLNNLSHKGGGIFQHIPDHTMCNTSFINFISNCFATVYTKVNVKFNGNNYDNLSIWGNNLENNIVELGGIQSGQEQNILFTTDISDINNFQIKLYFEYDGNKKEFIIDKVNNDNNLIISGNSRTNININLINNLNNIGIDNEQILYQIFKTILIISIEKGIRSGKLHETSLYLDNLYDIIENTIPRIINKKEQMKLQSLLKNIKSSDPSEGQVQKAFSSDEWFNRWGIHYLKYFVRSHQLQVCSNFKDPSLQLYGGKLFNEVRREVEEIFEQIPLPTPSLSNGQAYTGNFQQSFYNPSGPCFDGFGYVEMADTPYLKMVKDIVKGDKIRNLDGNVATVVCVLKTKIKNGSTDMIILNKLRITPWHPIRYSEEWVIPFKFSEKCDNLYISKWEFPSNIKESTRVHIDYVYDFILDKHHIVTINGIDIITLGHGFTHDPNLIHPFFGTEKVIDNLKEHPGWKNGLVEIDEYKPIFDNDGKIKSFF
jgi:hypothetical protein